MPGKARTIKRLNYPRREWKSFRGIHARLESDYEAAVDRLRQARDITGAITQRVQPSDSCSFGLAVLTLWCMAWEGTLQPTTFNRHNHPAFGIAVWLTLQQRPHSNYYVSQQDLRRDFRITLEASLATAMAVVQVMRSKGTYLFEPRLLRPTMFDCPASQTLANRMPVSH